LAHIFDREELEMAMRLAGAAVVARVEEGKEASIAISFGVPSF
jgi:hypothetical protein